MRVLPKQRAGRIRMRRLLEALGGGGPLPRLVRVPRGLDVAFNRLWGKSCLPPFQSWGGLIEESAPGKFKLKEESVGHGFHREWVPGSVLPPGYVGAFHAHSFQDGRVGEAFRGFDFAFSLNRSVPIAIVQSGDFR